MKKAVVSSLLAIVVSAASLLSFAAELNPAPLNTPILTVDRIRAGMKGVAYTVFQGTKPEPMDVEILGVLKNANGPKGDIILVRLQGDKPEFTGVVAGMSGSPVYVDGKLIGALAFRIGQFSKEAIAGVTPIADMLEISELDRTLPAEARGSRRSTQAPAPVAAKTSAPGMTAADPVDYLTPIETPIVFSGISESTLRQFAPQFEAAGITPVMGIGSASSDKQPEPLEPGSAVSAVLIQGDMNAAATCTVTYVDPQRLLACGHPLMQFGRVDIPMTKAEVVATLASPMNAFKIINTTEPVGAFVQDRHSGVLGRFGKKPDMIPVTLTVRGSGSQPKQFHYEVLNNARLTPLAVMTTVFNSLQGVNESGEEITYSMEGKISVQGYPDVTLENMFAPLETNQPAAVSLALSLGERFGRIFDNPYATPDITGVNLAIDLVRERRWARLESVRTDVTEARPGDDITIEAVLRPYRGDSILRQIPLKVPTSTPKGTLRILVSDGDTLDRTRRFGPALARKMDLGSTIALLNKEHPNTHLYVSLLEPNPQAMVEDKVMPGLPLSVMNVMDGMRGTQDMVVIGESSVNESSTPLDYVVAGAQVITLTVK